MATEYKWRLRVRSYEGDAWGQVSAAGMLRYLEHSAIAAAVDAGYGREFHEENNSSWVIRRMTLLFCDSPARTGDDLEIHTWLSHLAKVRGGREYRVYHAETGEMVAIALAEWVYVRRDTLRPIAIPQNLRDRLDLPGAPLGTYDAPLVEPVTDGRGFEVQRRAAWHETDSMEHINNAVYADWLDEAVRDAMAQLGWPVSRLKEQGLQLRGRHYHLDYKRAALPGDEIVIRTQITGSSADRCAVKQYISTAKGEELLVASSIYDWRTAGGDPASGPADWPLG